ncbi:MULTISPECIES: hypothetical protein [unclassified Rhodococcus (in: high G+C Gram-positive bacteria)]|uniref:hypothetical protein n=1 Tax=unclassified Rhodococcus (in: high G+C Gram-positive bacteria) TaxID=192944 RepID=UPI000B9A69DD|nr:MULTISPECIES: hypothetical protein [unclassified Rhodococcus (in: high G+C Gram-positive bacteria)]OZF42422.1 hypothetical protein CH291_25810 [Rhodococcus sp. 14-1411-2a]
MDPDERAAIIDEGYDPDDPAVRADLDHVRRLFAEHRHLTADPELSLDHLANAARVREPGPASGTRR